MAGIPGGRSGGVLATVLALVMTVLSGSTTANADVSSVATGGATTYLITIHDVGTFTADYHNPRTDNIYGSGPLDFHVKFQWDESRTATIEFKSGAGPSTTEGPLKLTASGTAMSSGYQGGPEENCTWAVASNPQSPVLVNSVNETGLKRTVNLQAGMPSDAGANGQLTASGTCYTGVGGGSINGPAPYLKYHPSSLNQGYDGAAMTAASLGQVHDLDLDQLAKKPIESSFPVNYTETEPDGGTDRVTVTDTLTVGQESDTCDSASGGTGSALGAENSGPRLVSLQSKGGAVKTCSLRVFALRWGKGSTPAVWDQDGEGGTNVSLASYKPNLSAGCNPSTDSEWIACSTPGDTQLNWPVAVVRGTKLNIASVQFRRSGPGDTTVIQDGTLFGEVQLPQTRNKPGGKLQFKRGGINLSADQGDLTIDDLTSDEALPDQVRLADKLFIKWHITQSKDPSRIDLGTSSHPVFVTFGAPVGGSGPESFISLLYPGTKAAAGTGVESVAVIKIWTKVFADHHSVRRVDFNPVTGTMKDGAPLSFWQENWSPVQDFNPPKTCQDLSGLLRTHVATCSGFAEYMVVMLRLQGISAHRIAPDYGHGWNRMVYSDAQYFLVGTWRPQQAPLTSDHEYRPDPQFPTVIEFQFSTANGGTARAAATQYAYVRASGQNNDTPPAMWQALAHPNYDLIGEGDHALVQLGNNGDVTKILGKAPIFDPSYGIGPKPNLTAWARVAIVGWAKFSDGSGNTVTIDRCGNGAGKITTCYLQIHVGNGL